ncbi:MAG: aminoglycoside phosphotransferase family protein [Acidobacteriota bacterium]
MPAFVPEIASAWLTRQGVHPSDAVFSELGGGVSNTVILAEMPDGRAILKQSLGKLRVPQEWLSDRGRIFREADAMRWLDGKTRGGHVPRLLAEDRENFSLAMEAAPPSLEMWKTQLFQGVFDPRCARAAGTLLGSIIAASWNHPEAEEIFRDQTVFDQLRIDPYYRFTALRHPEVASYFDALIARSGRRRVSLVHGDWSPKNLLVGGGDLWAIDWEVIHFGDPSYDVAFLLNHLLLKSIAMPGHRAALAALALVFMQALRAELPAEAAWLEGAAMEHLPALLLARVAGKSPAEYLDGGMRALAWERGLDLIAHPAGTAAEVWSR